MVDGVTWLLIQKAPTLNCWWLLGQRESIVPRLFFGGWRKNVGKHVVVLLILVTLNFKPFEPLNTSIPWKLWKKVCKLPRQMPSPELTDVKIDGWKTSLLVGPGLFSVASRQFQGVYFQLDQGKYLWHWYREPSCGAGVFDDRLCVLTDPDEGGIL